MSLSTDEVIRITKQTNCPIDRLSTVCAACRSQQEGNHGHTFEISCFSLRHGRLVAVTPCKGHRHRRPQPTAEYRVQGPTNRPAANSCAVWRPDGSEPMGARRNR